MNIIGVIDLIREVKQKENTYHNMLSLASPYEDLGFYISSPYQNISKYAISLNHTLIYYGNLDKFSICNKDNEEIFILESMYTPNSTYADGYNDWINLFVYAEQTNEAGAIISSKGVSKFAYNVGEDIHTDFDINTFDECNYFQISTIGPVPGIDKFQNLQTIFQYLQDVCVEFSQEISFDLDYTLETEL